MATEKKESLIVNKPKATCGIIMPIAPHVDYPKEHWKDVYNILREAIEKTDFEPKLVSDDVAVGLIHDRIVTNIYNNEIVVCDVSSKNPNVMFELGLRLAFDKPTIIIKDELTGYSFDTGVIEHLNYPSSLRFADIVAFQEGLINRISATYAKSQKEPGYSPFLKSFGKTLIAASIQPTEVSEIHYIIDELKDLKREVSMLRDGNNWLTDNDFKRAKNMRHFTVSKSGANFLTEEEIKELLEMKDVEDSGKFTATR